MDPNLLITKSNNSYYHNYNVEPNLLSFYFQGCFFGTIQDGKLVKCNFNEEFFHYLISLGMNINCGLILTILWPNLDMIKFVLDHGLDLTRIEEKRVLLKNGLSNFDITKYILKNYKTDIQLSDFNIYNQLLKVINKEPFPGGIKLLFKLIDEGCSLIMKDNYGNEFNALGLVRQIYYGDPIMPIKGTNLYLLEQKIIMKGLELWQSPHTNIILPFTNENLSQWKVVFISTLNRSPLIFHSSNSTLITPSKSLPIYNE